MLQLPSVTLCAVTSVNVAATAMAMEACLDKAAFAKAMLLSDSAPARLDARIQHVPIARLRSSRDYSEFLLRQLADHVETEHALVVQWDGFILDPARWDERFLGFDYIGAPWPQFSDANQVGNGGFSLRSRRLLQACQDHDFQFFHPEDIAIGRHNRRFLEQEHGCKFADVATAARFSHERGAATQRTFGFHGVFNLIPELGAYRFAEIVASLDERTAVNRDYRLLLRQLGSAPNGRRHQARLTWSRLRSLFA